MRNTAVFLLLLIALSRVNCTTKKFPYELTGFYVTHNETGRRIPVLYEEALADGGDVQMMMYNVMVQGLTVAQRVSEPKYFMVGWKVFVFFSYRC